MKFNDCGIIISKKNHSENSAIVKIFSQNHGIFRGFVKNAKAKNGSIFQVGNIVNFEWRSRIEESLGQFYSCDLVKSFQAKIIFDVKKLACFSALLQIIENSFAERENHDDFFAKMEDFLEVLAKEGDEEIYLADYIKLEIEILKNLGYGVDLSCCAVTATTENLVFVSPKSARAVCLEIGKDYENKLLKLPQFLVTQNSILTKNCLAEGFTLSGYFLEKFLFNSNFANEGLINTRNRIREVCL